MTEALLLLLGVVLNLVTYALLCVPGILVSRVLRKRPLPRQTLYFSLAFIRAIFFAPALVLLGHPVIVPAVVGIVAFPFFEFGTFSLWNVVPVSVVFLGSVIYDHMRSNRTVDPDARESGARGSS